MALDFYVTETTAQCDYILPVTTMYERDDFPYTFQAFQATPFRQATEAVVGGAARLGRSGTSSKISPSGWAPRVPAFKVFAAMRKALSLLGVTLKPRLMIDALHPDVTGWRPVRTATRRVERITG